MRSGMLLTAISVVLVNCSFLLAGPPPAPLPGGELNLKVTAVPEQASIMAGEPAFVAFKVENGSDRNLLMRVGGDYRNRLGRPDSFKFGIVGPDGNAVPVLDAGVNMGGLVHGVKLPAKGEHSFELFLPQWAAFDQPGRYQVTIRRQLELEPGDDQNGLVGKAIFTNVSATATVTVIPADPARFGVLINRLGKEMLDRESPRQERAERMLATIRDERVVPAYVALAKLPNPYPRQRAASALGRFGTEEAFAALKSLAKTTAADIRGSATTVQLEESSAGGVRHSAAIAIANNPHKDALTLLWTLVHDSNEGVRMTVLHRAAELKSPEAMAVIELISNDANERVRNEAKRYQRELDQ